MPAESNKLVWVRKRPKVVRAEGGTIRDNDSGKIAIRAFLSESEHLSLLALSMDSTSLQGSVGTNVGTYDHAVTSNAAKQSSIPKLFFLI